VGRGAIRRRCITRVTSAEPGGVARAFAALHHPSGRAAAQPPLNTRKALGISEYVAFGS
jgi:hypothetical protein